MAGKGTRSDIGVDVGVELALRMRTRRGPAGRLGGAWGQTIVRQVVVAALLGVQVGVPDKLIGVPSLAGRANPGTILTWRTVAEAVGVGHTFIGVCKVDVAERSSVEALRKRRGAGAKGQVRVRQVVVATLLGVATAACGDRAALKPVEGAICCTPRRTWRGSATATALRIGRAAS